MTTSASNEKRQFHRIPFDGPVLLSDAGKRWHTEIIDISLKGALIKRPKDWKGNLEHQYHLRLTLNASHHITMDAKVAHIEDDRIGLQCEHIDIESMSELRRLVELNLGDADLLDRDLAHLIH